MEPQDQSNQTPDQDNKSKIQDEKTLKVEATRKRRKISTKAELVIKVQISDTEKVSIVDMIHGRVSNLKALDNSKPVIKLQISDNVKNDIIDMIRDGSPKLPDKGQIIVENKSPKASETDIQADGKDGGTKESVNKQISKSERKSIIYLLHDNVPTVSQEISYDEVDFDKLNKQELVDMLEKLVQEKDISIIKSQVAKINSAFYQRNKEETKSELTNFISSGGKEEDFSRAENPLEVRHNAAISIYKYNKTKYSQDLEKQKLNNLKLKHELLEELKDLINSEETLKKTYDEFKKLQNKWKEIGMIPASELRNLWQSYHFLVEKFFDKVRINRELRDLDLKKNLESKLALCEKAEELIVEESILKSFKLLQFYHDKWREIGPVPIAVKEDLWARFKGITDKINLRRKEYYKELQDQQQANYETKLAICEKTKEIVSESVETLKGWQVTTEKVNELLKLWKTIGQAPKSKNDEVWFTFKGYLDTFFKSKREYLTELKGQQVNNYNLKIDLCTKAEVIKDSSDWGKTTRELINLQQEWKKIGPVPRKYSDKIWKKFRSSCDEFFKRKSEHFKNLHSVEDENLKKKRELVSKIVDYKVEKDKNADLNALKDFQKQWIDIGYVPFKEKEKIQSLFRTAIDKLVSKMDINKSELSAADFKNRLDLLRSSPDAGRRLSKERLFITEKIKKIKEDLDIWENNIGFFSNSKQSNKLKVEFEHKINNAKSEIDGLKAKLKLINF